MTAIESETPAEGQKEPTPEFLLDRVAKLVSRRQELRAAGAGRSELERNRAQITRAQWQLSRALIARHHHA